jgi:uncharacterized protein with HEPN domain
MKKDPLVHIDDIYDSIKAIQKYTLGLRKADFMASSEKQDAVVRRLEIIGEAANRLTDDFRSQYPEIPWSEIVGLRNVLIHEYDSIDLNRVWETILKDIPELERQIRKILLS